MPVSAGFRSSSARVTKELQQAFVEFVSQGRIFHAHVDVRIVVDLHDEDAGGSLLQVYAIQAAADQLRRPQCHIQYWRGYICNGHRGRRSLGMRAVRRVFQDLPVAIAHEVTRGKQRCAVKHADTPVEFRGHEVLQQNDFRAPQHPLDDVWPVRPDCWHAPRRC